MPDDPRKKALDQALQRMVKPEPQALYHLLGRLRNEMPPYQELGSASTTQWMGKALALVEASGSGLSRELMALRACFDIVTVQMPSEQVGIQVAQVLDTVLAQLELRLPADMQGAFIPAGGVFDGFQAVAKAIAEAKKHVMFVDPYADETVVFDFAPLVTESLDVLILGDEEYSKPALRPAAERWTKQWGTKRPLEVRLTPPRKLHDRLVVIDATTAWVLGQSFNGLAKRAHSSLVKMDPESGTLKINAHVDMWTTATKLA